ncbi:hypothetical protein [Sphaerisporangium fuscum]|uniref:hypothetical protein n=1 Tax=Sphaerisporangium fuscum TaxID=2835868 RepID=UPI001BDCC537|nr:hypothetical protein [Sphaerisporangium fuscum]
MNTTATTVRVHADHAVEKRLGNWTTSQDFEVRVRRGQAVLDLRSPEIPEGDVTVTLDLDHGMLKLLVPADAEIDQWDLEWSGRGKVKQSFHHNPAAGTGRRIRLAGHVHQGEVRVHSGGVAQLSAMFTREYVDDVRRAHKTGGRPTVDDPARTV